MRENMEINILIEEGIEPEPETGWMQKLIESVLIKENLPPNIEMSLLITGQARIQELNKEYRGKDQPTDVLSFSLAEQKEGEPEAFIGPPDGLLHMGEIIISYPQAVLQARESGHGIKKEMASLIIHGILHMLSYDHENKELALAMQAREREILEQLEKEIA
jgi:probable rRNA maturation factor